MKIQWLGHSCFKISHNGYSVVLDPHYIPNAHYPPVCTEGDMVLVSHEHHGHNHREGVRLTGEGKTCPFELDTVESFHDTQYGLMRGKNTIHIIKWDGFKLVHMGDQGTHLPPEAKEKLKDADLMMINAGSLRSLPTHRTQPLAVELNAKVVIPMHYMHDRIGSNRMGDLPSFVELYYGSDLVKYYETDTFELTKDTPKQVAVMKYLGSRCG